MGYYELEQVTEENFFLLNRLGNSSLNKLLEIYNTSGVTPDPILNGIKNAFFHNSQKIDLSICNIHSLLTNKTITNLLLSAKENIFSREDRASPKDRLNFFVYSVAKDITEMHHNDVDYSSIKRFNDMFDELNSYDRFNKNNNFQPTEISNTIRKELTRILRKYKTDFQEENMIFHLLGSLRYGDANDSSDIDCNIIVYDEVDLDFVDALDEDIETNLRSKTFSMDHYNIISLLEYQNVMVDITDEETTRVQDYADFKDDIFHPYDWLLQGEDLLEQDLPVSKELKSTKEMIHKAINVDPLFELLCSYKLFYSLEKRKDNLSRK